MELKYKCKDEFKGEVVIDVPNYIQRCEYQEEIGLEYDDDGELKIDGSVYKKMAKMAQLAAKHIKSVDVEHKGNGSKADSYDALLENALFDTLIQKLGFMVLQGRSLGE